MNANCTCNADTVGAPYHVATCPKASANDKQVGGDHYQKPVQPWDYIIANDIGYMEGNIIKYVSRWRDKGGVQDLRKAQHYLQKLIEVLDAGREEQESVGI